MNNGQRKRPAGEVGAAWIKQSQNGSEYISIQLYPEAMQEYDLANCFIDMYWNEKKQRPNAPDYHIKAKPKQQRQGAPAPRQQQRPQMPRPGQQRPQNFAPQSSSYGPPDDDGDPGY